MRLSASALLAVGSANDLLNNLFEGTSNSTHIYKQLIDENGNVNYNKFKKLVGSKPSLEEDYRVFKRECFLTGVCRKGKLGSSERSSYVLQKVKIEVFILFFRKFSGDYQKAKYADKSS